MQCVFYPNFKKQIKNEIKKGKGKKIWINIVGSQVSAKEKNKTRKWINTNSIIQENLPKIKTKWNYILELRYLRILTQNNQYLHII